MSHAAPDVCRPYTTATDTPGGGQYRYRLQAYNDNGESAYTGYVAVKVR